MAHAGAPATDDLPWPAYDARPAATCVLDRTPRVVDDPEPELRALWDELRPPARLAAVELEHDPTDRSARCPDRSPHHFPTFSSPDEERTHMKQRMAAAFRLFDKFGFNEGVAGHLTGATPSTPSCSGSTRSA